MDVSLVPALVAALVVLTWAAPALWWYRRRRSHRDWQRQWDELVRSQPELDWELDEVSRRFPG